MNVHSNHLEMLALHNGNEFTCYLRADYFYSEGIHINRTRCAMPNREIGALDAPSRIPAGSMKAHCVDYARHIDLAYQYRGE